MDPKRWKQIDELIDAALEVEESQRSQFVESRTDGDPELRAAVMELLSAQGETDDFLRDPAMKVVARALADEAPENTTGESLLGRTIANYKIEKILGAGGMGEVYLAFDEKMRRKVALKVLPIEYGRNDERVKRFEIEARAISSINHPNIVTIYDVGNADGINYIATEFVEGKTLRELIGGRFKLRNVMANSIQICDALSAAHAEGIIHRDIKPENIMIRKDGYAKILDFGVAKLTEVDDETLTPAGNTVKGMMIGTPAYMSPAQVVGDEIDHRSDLWSCGVVLYEFITGVNPFRGENRQETFEAILSKTPPPVSSLNPETQPELDRILARIFVRDPQQGYSTASELRADLKAVKRELDSYDTDELNVNLSAVSKRPKSSSRTVAYGIAGTALPLLILAAAYLGITGGFFRAKGTEWIAATSSPVTNQAGIEYFPSLSPDGKDLVYAGQENGQLDIFLIRVGSKKATNLTQGSPSDDTMPAFSPKGNLIAFRSDRDNGGIFVFEPSGDNLRKISDFGYHPSFSPDGKQIVISTWGRDQPTVRPGTANSLQVVDIETGKSRKLLDLDATHPTWSPNGDRIAYWFYTGTYGRRDIATIPSSGGEPVVVTKDFAVSNWNPVWSPDGKFLYFVSSKAGSMNFWRIAIDEKTGIVKGEPEPVVTPSSYSRHITFARDAKRMAYVQTRNTSNIQGINFDLASMKTLGDPFWITKGDREISRAELSPDGTRFVMRLIKPTQDDIVIVNRDGAEWRDVTDDEPFDRYIRWSPDGKRLAFSSDRNVGTETWVSNADGTGLRQVTFGSDEAEAATGFPTWSPDGAKLAVYQRDTCFLVDANTGERLFTLPRPPNASGMVPWDWSIDGTKLAGVIIKGSERLIGYYSFETGNYETFTGLESTIPVQWTPDGKHLLYARDRTIMAIDIQSGHVKELYSSPENVILSPFVSRDGKLLYYTAGNYESDIWMLDLTEKN